MSKLRQGQRASTVAVAGAAVVWQLSGKQASGGDWRELPWA